MAKNTFAAAITGLTLALGLGFSAPSDAALQFQSCSGTDYDITGALSPTAGCTMLLDLDDNENDSLAVINTTPGFFNYTDWKFDGKWDGLRVGAGGNDSSTYFSFTGNNSAGTFTRDAVPANLGNFMFVFKDGADTNLVGYLLDANTISGTYGNPFTDPPFDLNGAATSHEISHISVYYRTQGGPPATGPVPEPGTVTLLGLGLLGAFFYRRKLLHKDA